MGAKLIDKIITRLGKANDSEIATAALAAFKLAFIPLATMSDKKSTKEQKEYAIKRDTITETTALTSYLLITNLVKNNLTAPVCAKYYKQKADELVKQNKLSKEDAFYKTLSNVDKKALKNYASSVFGNKKEISKEQKESMLVLEKTINSLQNNIQNPKDLYINTKKVISHVCVCTLALTVIPFVTNKIIKTISNLKQEPSLGKTSSKVSALKPVSLKQYANYTRIGGQNVLRY